MKINRESAYRGNGRDYDGVEDTPAMAVALEWLKENAIPFRRPTYYQVKVGILNFWPDRGTITVDGGAALAPGGWDAFRELVRCREGARQGRAGQGPTGRGRKEQARIGQGATAHIRTDQRQSEPETTEQDPHTSASNVVHLTLHE
jgi:hypothetical protein